jgi:Tfp pilus assembly protein PilF
MTGTVTTLKRIVAALLLVVCASCATGQQTQNRAEYHFKLGAAYLADENFTAALVELTEAEKLMPENPELMNYLGRTYYAKKRYDLAEQKYLQAIQLKPDFPEARNNLGVNYLEMKRWDAAITQLRKVTDDLFYPHQENALMNLGLAYYGKGDFPMALNVFRSMVVSYPRDPRGHLHFGRVYFAMGKVELAVVEYRAALDLYRNYPEASFNLGLALLKLKDIPAASAAFRDVLRLAPNTELGHLSREYLDSLR